MHIDSSSERLREGQYSNASVLAGIQTPADVRCLSREELMALASELRLVIDGTIARRGGHLASNLGAVELTLALHRVYDAPRDKILFDVGHQCYAHKLITGRREAFDTLRSEGGISGFPTRQESEYDAFGVGHASTAVSAALGFARARDALAQDHHIVAVVGDGALTGGEAYEALNDAGRGGSALVVVLNDNGMSISANVGGLTRYLNRLRSAPWYWRIKNRMTAVLDRFPKMGGPLYRGMQSVKNGIKYLFFKGQFFDALGFVYLGPVDGHDIGELERTFVRAKSLGKPVLVHVATRKGKGLPDAEEAPERYHGVSGAPEAAEERACGLLVGEMLADMAREDARICAVTAAMPQGTGLAAFAAEHPDRFYDVGIAEEHAATLCAGLAAGGMRPYFAVYSTFFQRCFDQTVHDVALQSLPVTFLLDRAGLVGEDGATHQGVYDIALLSMLPGFSLFAPASIASLRSMIALSRRWEGPLAIRYPRALRQGESGDFAPGVWKMLKEGAGTVVLAVGPMAYPALDAARDGKDVCIVAVESILPMDMALLASLKGRSVLTVEEGSAIGGFGALVAKTLSDAGIAVPTIKMLGTPALPIVHATRERQRNACGLDAQGIAIALKEMRLP